LFHNITDALAHIKSDVARALDASLITRVCVELGHRWRNRQLDPAATVSTKPTLNRFNTSAAASELNAAQPVWARSPSSAAWLDCIGSTCSPYPSIYRLL